MSSPGPTGCTGRLAAQWLYEHGGTLEATGSRFGICGDAVRQWWHRLFREPVPTKAEAATLREIMLEQISSRPRQAAAIFDDVAGEWGRVDERRLWRLLRRLIEDGAVVMVGQLHRGSSYMRPCP